MVAKILSHGLRRVGHQRRHVHAAGASQQELDGFIVDEAGGRVLVDRAPARLQEDTSECHKTSGIHWLQTSRALRGRLRVGEEQSSRRNPIAFTGKVDGYRK